MVKIAVAGGSGEVAREIVDASLAAKKHEITILSRTKSSSIGNSTPGLICRTVSYDDKSDLVEALQGIHTVLSFIQVMKDPGSKAQKTLIDAAIIAGVKRFAPSEWGSAGTAGMPWWAGKEEVREYLKKVNENGKVGSRIPSRTLVLVLEQGWRLADDPAAAQVFGYTLFQPGLFLDYLAFPYKTARHVTPLNTMIDFQNRRAIVVDAHDSIMTLTTAQDLAAVVARAVEDEGEWPEVGGICGNKVTISQILEIGQRVRGCPFIIDKVQIEDLEQGILKSSWTLEASHPSVSKEQAENLARTVLIGTLLSGVQGAWAISDEFNQLLPGYKFTQIEEFLAKVWAGKP